MPSDKRARQRAAREARLAEEAKRSKRRKQIRNGIIVVVVAGLIVAIAFIVSSGNKTPAQSKSTTSTTAAGSSSNAKAQAQANEIAVKAGCPASTKATVNTQKYSAAPAMTIDTSKTYTATVKTTAGTFDITLDAKAAPTTVNNFVFLANKGFYHCVIFHRVIPGFMDQTGDPTGTGSGGPGYSIPDELPAKATPQYPLGSVAMANSGPNTGGSQFFIVAGPEGETLQPNYSLFGQVSSGMSVVDSINKQGNSSQSSNGVPPDVTQRILSITIKES
ncbi:MAG TPA: peptidylprolyl isomerase [Acidimicrobiales bacterium]|nr:peptidylprolyl isomerase [Acidimicrobiales bacterium]